AKTPAPPPSKRSNIRVIFTKWRGTNPEIPMHSVGRNRRPFIFLNISSLWPPSGWTIGPTVYTRDFANGSLTDIFNNFVGALKSMPLISHLGSYTSFIGHFGHPPSFIYSTRQRLLYECMLPALHSVNTYCGVVVIWCCYHYGINFIFFFEHLPKINIALRLGIIV